MTSCLQIHMQCALKKAMIKYSKISIDVLRKERSFYCATRMHSTDYAVARCLSVSPSICHILVLCLNDYTYPQSFFTVG